MKKNISVILMSVFLFHFFVTIFININAFGYLKINNRDKNLNNVGKCFLKLLPKSGQPLFISQYANYSGISRGYAYYSPNVRNIHHDYKIYDNNNNTVNIMSTKETKLKFNTLMTNLTDIINNGKARKSIVSSLYKIALMKRNNLTSMTVDLEIKKINPLSTYNFGKKRDSIKIINAFKIKEDD